MQEGAEQPLADLVAESPAHDLVPEMARTESIPVSQAENLATDFQGEGLL